MFSIPANLGVSFYFSFSGIKLTESCKYMLIISIKFTYTQAITNIQSSFVGFRNTSHVYVILPQLVLTNPQFCLSSQVISCTDPAFAWQLDFIFTFCFTSLLTAFVLKRCHTQFVVALVTLTSSGHLREEVLLDLLISLIIPSVMNHSFFGLYRICLLNLTEVICF